MTDIKYKLNDWLFDVTKQTLTRYESCTQLEPRQADVLLYFCQHPQQIISRDELMEKVWQGQIVTDNAINRVIANLRRSLGDDAKNHQFIQTLPRKGYKFIAKISQAKEGYVAEEKDKKGINKGVIFSVLSLLLLVSFVFLLNLPSKQAPQKTITALTRGGGQEDGATISPNGKYLSYLVYEEKTPNKLFLKDLENGDTTQLSDNQGNAGTASWSDDNSRLVYFYNNENICQIRVITLAKNKVVNKETVHNCPLSNSGRVTFHHDGKQIIYSEKQSREQSYYLYSMSLESGKTQKLKQPKSFKAGHIDFDLHPRENKLLISTPDEQLKMSFYQLDLEQDVFSFLFSKDDYICCAIWNEQADKIVVMGAHPAYSLVEMALDGTNTQTVYTGSHRVSPPKRIPNSSNYVYSGGHFNFDISYYDFSSKQTLSIANSSVVDRLPAISNDGSTLAYISRQTGTSQIWLHNIVSKHQQLLTKFTDHRRYLDLKFSPDDKLLAALIEGAIKLIDVNSGMERQLRLPQQIIRGMSWLDSETLSYSIESSGKWRVHHYNINTNEETAFDEEWAYIKYAAKTEEIIYINHNNELFINNQKLNIKSFNVVDFNRVFNFQLLNNSLYYRAHEPESMDIYQLVLSTLEENIVLKTSRPGVIQVSQKGIYFTYLKNQSADIFRTH